MIISSIEIEIRYCWGRGTSHHPDGHAQAHAQEERPIFGYIKIYKNIKIYKYKYIKI